MQIHELNNRRKPTNEGILDTAKAVVQNPHSLWNSSALATAQQQATQASAAASAAELANPGSQTLSTRKLRGSQPVTVGGTQQTGNLSQQIQAVKSNTALQQQIKNLSSQWASQSAAFKKAQQSTVSEANVAQFDPRELVNDPKYATVLKALQAAGVDPTKQVELEKQLSAWKLEFDTWAKSKLGNISVNVDALRQDPEVKKMLESALSKIATAAQSGNANLENEAVNEYFTIVIAANQIAQKTNPRAVRSIAPSPVATAQQDDAEILKKYGYNTSSSQLSDLSTAMRRAANGGTVIRDTGNEALNALARLAGFKVAET